MWCEPQGRARWRETFYWEAQDIEVAEYEEEEITEALEHIDEAQD
jgi:hypothetical protein